MIQPQQFLEQLQNVGLTFFVGVPDSLLKDFCACVDKQLGKQQHVIAANEGNAVAMAAGFHMATRQSAVVYMQNSGLGNTINPLASLADKDVYRIPMLLLIGWRGEPGVKDEPQHVTQGRITQSQLELLNIPYRIINDQTNSLDTSFWVADQLKNTNAPVALLVQAGTFSSYKATRAPVSDSLQREAVIRQLLDLTGDAPIVSTTGKTSRELFELRAERAEPQRDFLTVGGMGHTASIALGVALGQPAKKVICLDGDGSLLMHLGAMPVIGKQRPANLLHILLNNGAHESVGGQPTAADTTEFRSVALASGYREYRLATTSSELTQAWQELATQPGPSLLEVRIAVGSRADLGRPTSSPQENKASFMEWLSS